MHPNTGSGTKDELFLAGRKAAQENGAGVVGSLLLHGLAALAIFAFIVKSAPQTAQNMLPFVPVDLVRLGMETESPPAARKALVPQQKAAAQRQADEVRDGDHGRVAPGEERDRL